MLSLQREFLIDNLLVRIHFIIVMIRWTGLAPWEVESPFPVSLTSTFLEQETGVMLSLHLKATMMSGDTTPCRITGVNLHSHVHNKQIRARTCSGPKRETPK